MVMKRKYRAICGKCSDILYPHKDINKLNGITVHAGTCPHCKEKSVMLIPIHHLEYASNPHASSVEWN